MYTEKAIGRTIVYVSDGNVVTIPMVNMRIEGGRFQITGQDNAVIREVYQRILQNYSPRETYESEDNNIFNDPLLDETIAPGADLTIREVMRFDSLQNAWKHNDIQ